MAHVLLKERFFLAVALPAKRFLPRRGTQIRSAIATAARAARSYRAAAAKAIGQHAAPHEPHRTGLPNDRHRPVIDGAIFPPPAYDAAAGEARCKGH